MSVLVKNITSLVFFLGCLAYVYLKLEGTFFLEHISKYVIVALLTLYYLVRKSKTNYLFLAIIIFQMIGDVIVINQIDHESFMIGVPFFFIVNILLVYLIMQKVVFIKLQRVFTPFIISTLLILTIVYLVFSKVGLMLFLVVSFSVMVVVLMTATLYYCRVKKENVSSRFLLVSMCLLLLVYIFGGVTRLINPVYGFKLIVAVSYLGHLYSLTRYILAIEKESAA